jgi:D-serine deaminase-like pyridoxal phosphate-dependent protein
VRGVSQEHGLVGAAVAPGAAAAGAVAGRLAVGDKLRILPNHSCLTAALFDHYDVVRGEDVVDRWTIWRRR